MRRHYVLHIAVALLVLAAVIIGYWQTQWDLSVFAAWMARHRILGMLAYTVFAAASVVLLPFSSLPLLPLAAGAFGVWWTAALSIVGWWTGCLLAFQIARMGRPAVERITSLEAVDRLERTIPEDIGFAGIVILRMILPVDVVSFALGFLKRLSFPRYALASLMGIVPFAFVWSYAGGELVEGAYWSAVAVFIGMTVVVLLVRRVWGLWKKRG